MSELLLKMPIPYEPKLSNRWLVRFKGDYKGVPVWAISKTSRPKWSASGDTTNINNANSYSIMSKGRWENIEINLRDIIGSPTSKILFNACRLAGKGGKAKVKYDLEILDASGVTVEKWNIKGIVETFDFGDLEYSNDSILEIKLNIRPTKVILEY